MPIEDWIPTRSNIVSGIIGGLFGGGLVGPLVAHCLHTRRDRVNRALQLADAAAARTAVQVEAVANQAQDLLALLHRWREAVNAAKLDAHFTEVMQAYNSQSGEFAAKYGAIGEPWKSDAVFNRVALALSNLSPQEINRTRGVAIAQSAIMNAQSELIGYMSEKLRYIGLTNTLHKHI
jgi:hypothetical protein